jgi:hypothetical protein
MARLSLDRQPLEDARLVSGMNAKRTERCSPEMGDAPRHSGSLLHKMIVSLLSTRSAGDPKLGIFRAFRAQQ